MKFTMLQLQSPASLYFIVILTMVSGYGDNFMPNLRRLNLEDETMEPSSNQGIPFFPSRNTKRMTIEEGPRGRGGWEQMNSQYYPQPVPQYRDSYYPNMQSGGNYFSSTQPTTPSIPVMGMYKPMDKQHHMPPQRTQQPPEHNKPRPKIAVPKLNENKNSFDSASYPSTNSKAPGKKLKVLICRLQQAQN